jgi:hypothetical protein
VDGWQQPTALCEAGARIAKNTLAGTVLLWPAFTGDEWQLPTDVPGTDRLLIGWRWVPEPVDAGPPPPVATLLATALTRQGTVTFASATRSSRDIVWVTTASADEAARGIFDAGVFNWNLRGQVAILAAPGAVLNLNQRHLQLHDGLFTELRSMGAPGVLLPGVDGAVAGLYVFNPLIRAAVQRDLEDLTHAAGGQCVVAAGAAFAAALRA